MHTHPATRSDPLQIVLRRARLNGRGACADFTPKSAALVKTNPTEWTRNRAGRISSSKFISFYKFNEMCSNAFQSTKPTTLAGCAQKYSCTMRAELFCANGWTGNHRADWTNCGVGGRGDHIHARQELGVERVASNQRRHEDPSRNGDEHFVVQHGTSVHHLPARTTQICRSAVGQPR